MRIVSARLYTAVIAAMSAAVVVSRPLAVAQPPAGAGGRSPKLLVLIAVDQMRADYIDRFQHQWSHGLHRLVTQGAWFRQNYYPYANTVTCAGHSTIGTGTIPAVHGMILNSWWDRAAHQEMKCVDDESAAIVSYGRSTSTVGESLSALRTTTLADELRAQLSPAGRVIGFSLKARSVISLSGRRPAAVAWFDDVGAWVTSTAFSKGPVPEVADFIARNPVERDFGRTWDRALPKDAYFFEDPAIGAHPTKGMSNAFPHLMRGAGAEPDGGFYDRWQISPMIDDYMARMAADVAERLKIGRTSSTDMIALSFSALDKVGHDFGPHSHEIQDVLVRLDRTLGDLFAALDRLVGPDNYTVALSADHGVAPIPERSIAEGLDAGRVTPQALTAQVEKILGDALGPAGTGPPAEHHKWIDRFIHSDFYLAPGAYEKLTAQPVLLEQVRYAIRALPGILRVYTRDELAANRLDDDPIGRNLAHSFYAPRSGDLIIAVRPYWIVQTTGTTHGTSYAYDAHVPLIFMGKGVMRGEYLSPAEPTDIAPTLAFLAGVTLPNVRGRVLAEALTASVPPRRSSD
jgi:predicted AlkP superfamily pyrophosphatase or phosphodiesterase